jgi:hypothetical protein
VGRTFGLLALAAFLALGGVATQTRAATPFDGLLGTWSGSGQVRYQDGRAEAVKCSAYYSEGGERLRLAIRCRSAGSEIEVRGLLTQRGSSVAGTWEERTFNVSGEVAGRITASRLSLTITGGAFSGSMSVDFGGARQSVVISTQGISMRSVNVTLGKAGS